MKRLNAVFLHPLYQEYYGRLEHLESEREFCCHQLSHLLDVARIAYIHSLERGLNIEKEVIYTAAILHDIGKSLQYEQKIPHEISGAELAENILNSLPQDSSFSSDEILCIITAIRGHRRLRKDAQPLEQLLFESDKESRTCFACRASFKCNWSLEQKNMEIVI